MKFLLITCSFLFSGFVWAEPCAVSEEWLSAEESVAKYFSKDVDSEFVRETVKGFNESLKEADSLEACRELSGLTGNAAYRRTILRFETKNYFYHIVNGRVVGAFHKE